MWRACLPPPLRHSPDQIGFGRRGGVIEIVSVETKPGLEPERVASSETTGLYFWLFEEEASNAHCILGRNNQLIAVFSGVARA